MPLHVPGFGGGVVLLGSSDTQRTDELLSADGYDIGPRGQLIAASDVSDYYTLKDLQGVPASWTKLHGVGNANILSTPYIAAIGEGLNVTPVLRYLLALLERESAAVPLPANRYFEFTGITPGGKGVYVTIEQFPGIVTGVAHAVLINIGAREGLAPNTEPGLYAYVYGTTLAGASFNQISYWDALGTGTNSGGTNGKPLFFRGIASYNNFVFGWGHEQRDATTFDGPTRVMFCNLGNPLKWGNDNISVVADRAFTDSDAIILGDAGENIRGALKWNGKLYFGTNQQLHSIGGFGRDSFITDGANPIAKSHNVVGPHGMVEGPDRLMYGVGDQGLWSFDGGSFEPHFRRLVDLDGRSSGYWDLIWTDPTAALGLPGRTNQDLVWTAVDWDREQVVIGIPYCNAAAGAGAGTDTVVIKFHVRSGGFTRQVFTGVILNAASYVRREAQQRESRVLGSNTGATVKRYGYQATPTTSPAMAAVLPSATLGPYAAFGPDGEGVLRRAYLTLKWASAASLPIVFTITTTIDEGTVDTITLTVKSTAPAGPVAGDIWVDTSQSDTSLGNATAGTLVAAAGGYLVKVYRPTGSSNWFSIPGSGEVGTRALIPIPITRRAGTRFTMAARCTSAAGRFQLESFGLTPGGGKDNA